MGLFNYLADKLGRTSTPDIVAEAPCGACPLTGVIAGQIACLDCIHAGKRLKHRLAELGLTPGVEMMVLQNNGGPLLLSVRDSRLALGRGMAARLQVTPVPPTGNV